MKDWLLQEKAPADFFSEFPEYPPVVLQLLHDRGLKTQEQIDEFFNSDYGIHLQDPYLFVEMAKAVDRIITAIRDKEKIIIYGDYDADGVCGSVVMHNTLSALGADFDIYIPDRFSDGYGLNRKAMAEIIKQKVGLIITVDCGVTDKDEVDFANGHGIDVIIVDHHLVPPEVPAAYAIIDAKKDGEKYPFKLFCATGVAFKLAHALLTTDFAKTADIKEGFEKWLLDLVAIASIADMVPLLGENRTLVKYGLIVLEKTKRVGLKMLLSMPTNRVANHYRKTATDKITSETIAFLVAPRINATSRMAHATTSFELLVAQDKDAARELADRVEDLNNERRDLVEKILKEIEVELKEAKAKDILPAVIFKGKEAWPPGVVGLVANRMTDRYGRPAFIYGGAIGHFKGSCRGIEGFHVVQAMRYCQEKFPDLLMEFGGHPRAGGFAILPEKLNKFEEYLLEFAGINLEGQVLKPVIQIDAELRADDVNWELFDWLLQFEPYGESNKKPVFIMKDMNIASFKAVGKKEDHLKMKLKSTLATGAIKFFDCIGFGLSDRMINDKIGDKVDIVFELEANEWNGTRELQLKLKDIRKSNG